MDVIVGGSLKPNGQNVPTRVGELINNISELENIPNPRVGMEIWLQEENKGIRVLSLKAKEIGGIVVPNSAVDKWEYLDARLQGTSESSDPMADPFKKLFAGNSTALAEVLNSTINNGRYRIVYGGFMHVDLNVWVKSNGTIIQTIEGFIENYEGGIDVSISEERNSYLRTGSNSNDGITWNEWEVISGSSVKEMLDANIDAVNNEITRATQAEQENKKAIEIAHNTLGLTTTIGVEEFIAFSLPDNAQHVIGVQQITFDNGYFKMYDATLSKSIGFTDGGLAVANPTGIREYWCKVARDEKYYIYYARINWDVAVQVPWSATPAETFTVSPYPRAHSVAGSNLLNMLQRLDYDIAEVTRYNGDGIAEVQSVTWRDGTTGTATYSDYRADVLEYTTLTVTYNSYVKVVQAREYNDTGDLTKKTTILKNA